jgi:hypothetical protein
MHLVGVHYKNDIVGLSERGLGIVTAIQETEGRM